MKTPLVECYALHTKFLTGSGGDGHSGVSPGRGFNALEMAARLFYGHQEGPSYSNAKSFTDPNAICPVCGAEVFFYR
jgi:hypothetical protein